MLKKFTNILFALSAIVATASASASVVISQVYGGGGNSSAPYSNDFIEIFNAGTTGQDVTGWSVQYASSAGTAWQVTALPSVTLAPGHYLLVQEASGGATGAPLPTADATGTISLSASNGKVALVSSATALSGSCPSGAPIVDFIGFGTANCPATNAAPAGSNTTALLRAGGGCTNTNVNSSDFSAGTPNPRNTLDHGEPLQHGRVHRTQWRGFGQSEIRADRRHDEADGHRHARHQSGQPESLCRGQPHVDRRRHARRIQRRRPERRRHRDVFLRGHHSRRSDAGRAFHPAHARRRNEPGVASEHRADGDRSADDDHGNPGRCIGIDPPRRDCPHEEQCRHRAEVERVLHAGSGWRR